VRITIITPSFQQADFLEECLRSVATQDHPEVEHIVVDGGSTDGSVDIIQRYASGLAWWCSVKDEGQSDAINKGLAHATGEVFGWINSDDLLLPGALREVAEVFASDPAITVVTARRRKRHADGSEEVMPLESDRDVPAWFVRPLVNQQATFYRMDVVREVGGVDTMLHYVMDLELWWRVLFTKGTAGVRVLDREWAVFRMHAASKSTGGMPAFVAETAALLHDACVQVGASEWSAILALGHPQRIAPRSLPVDGRHRDRVVAMAFHFLLKWHGGCHDRTSYRMMRRLHALAQGHPRGLDAKDLERWAALEHRMRAPGWWAFLLQRKWKHLFA
jgi:glycosyltransferase involved in cell wall biosynthesis